MSDYLYDPTAPPEPDVAALERVLGVLAEPAVRATPTVVPLVAIPGASAPTQAARRRFGWWELAAGVVAATAIMWWLFPAAAPQTTLPVAAPPVVQPSAPAPTQPFPESPVPDASLPAASVPVAPDAALIDPFGSEALDEDAAPEPPAESAATRGDSRARSRSRRRPARPLDLTNPFAEDDDGDDGDGDLKDPFRRRSDDDSDPDFRNPFDNGSRRSKDAEQPKPERPAADPTRDGGILSNPFETAETPRDPTPASPEPSGAPSTPDMVDPFG